LPLISPIKSITLIIALTHKHLILTILVEKCFQTTTTLSKVCFTQIHLFTTKLAPFYNSIIFRSKWSYYGYLSTSSSRSLCCYSLKFNILSVVPNLNSFWYNLFIFYLFHTIKFVILLIWPQLSLIFFKIFKFRYVFDANLIHKLVYSHISPLFNTFPLIIQICGFLLNFFPPSFLVICVWTISSILFAISCFYACFTPILILIPQFVQFPTITIIILNSLFLLLGTNQGVNYLGRCFEKKVPKRVY